jgi:hypothetical protein
MDIEDVTAEKTRRLPMSSGKFRNRLSCIF